MINNVKGFFLIQLCNEQDGSCLKLYYGGMKKGDSIFWVDETDSAMRFNSNKTAVDYALNNIPHNDWQIIEKYK